ncbi:hypothetical protein ANN_01982 [Periplaneta americana]|uniref:Uncharacterized protein n=1 Tax=Periplaneta americana TaxID=6978 RepID=A0ABQ8TZ65_PERAM|nr:hypothetical protein ANN_01982 [Periplaneta americana]
MAGLCEDGNETPGSLKAKEDSNEGHEWFVNDAFKLRFVYGDHRRAHIVGDCRLELRAVKMNAHAFFKPWFPERMRDAVRFFF